MEFLELLSLVIGILAGIVQILGFFGVSRLSSKQYSRSTVWSLRHFLLAGIAGSLFSAITVMGTIRYFAIALGSPYGVFVGLTIGLSVFVSMNFDFMRVLNFLTPARIVNTRIGWFFSGLVHNRLAWAISWVVSFSGLYFGYFEIRHKLNENALFARSSLSVLFSWAMAISLFVIFCRCRVFISRRMRSSSTNV